MSIKVACGTDDGVHFTKEHFGDSKKFLIYEVDENGFRLVKEIENTSEEEEMHGDPKKAKRISEIVGDVDVLFAFAMGPNIVRMRKRYIPVISRIESIEEAMKKLIRNIDKIKEQTHKEEKDVIIIK